MSIRRPLKRGKKYDKITDEERRDIMKLKQDGVGCKEIAKIFDKNLKTIQSVQNSERKSEYKSLKEAVSKYGFDQVLQVTSVQFMDSKKLKKLVNKIVKDAIQPNDKSLFGHLIPQHKADSNKRRIIDQISENIFQNLQNYLEFRILPYSYDLNNQSSRDTMSLENSDHSYSTYNSTYEVYEDKEQVLFQNFDEMTPIDETPLENVSEMNQQMEASSIIFSNNHQFDKNIEESSDDYFVF